MRSLSPAARRGLADEATDRIRDAILSGELSPGEKVGEAELSRVLTVSRGPVREALVRLEQEGLVISEWHKGTTVVDFTKSDIRQLATLRLALEQMAASEASRVATPEDFLHLHDIIEQMQAARLVGNDDALVRLDAEFHDAIYQAAHHPRLYAAWSTIRSQVALALLRRRALPDDYAGIVVGEHSELAKVLASNDPARMVELITSHLESAYTRLLANFD
jgi:DNA-binding GntR family transcriptional regulator